MTDSTFTPNFDRAAAYPLLGTLRTALRDRDWDAVRALYDPADWDLRNLLVLDASEQEGSEVLLREVVARDPDDLVAATMLGVRLVEIGWRIRTSARAQQVSGAQFSSFFAYLREAEQILISVCARDPGIVSAWYERVVTARGLNAPTFRYLTTLPTDPDLLLLKIYRETWGHGTNPQQEAFTTIGDLIRESVVPPDLAVALYRAAARIPGVTVVDDSVDALGRHGVAVARAENGGREEWIFDRDTLQFRGERDVLADGTVGGSTAIVARAVVDHAGDVPA
jgi:hypothetical protein